MFPAFVQVYNDALKQQVSFEEVQFASFAEARKYKEDLKRDYGNIGCHTVRVFMEVFPEPEEDDLEEEFDADELEEEE